MFGWLAAYISIYKSQWILEVIYLVIKSTNVNWMHNNSDQLIFAPLNQSTRKMFNFYLYALIDKSKTNKNIKHIYFLFQSPSIIQS